ncbi:ShlB/FhaC/HecB family hemolysin secretion/activation protein, partial [Salmonella enterica subsp. enterica serovar Oslo]|nr:ShlB/FhaC/HecB family hemolysin secretion/activation protein [Salmonella enterica subsp. enterica serovar Oslo]
MKSLFKRTGRLCLQKTRSLSFPVASLTLFCAGAHAATPPVVPGAGTLGNQLRQESVRTPAAPVSAPLVLPQEGPARQAMSADNHTTVVVKKVVFSGLPVGQGPDELRLQQQVAGSLNRPLTFAGLASLAQSVTDLYRSEGFLVARAVLPPQTVKDGVLTIDVIPGRYDQAQLSNSSPLRDGLARQIIRTTTPEGEVLSRAQLEREALLLSEIPGVKAQVSMKSGRLPGTTTPDITLTPGKRFGGYAGLDNQGDRTTGRSRVMAGFYASGLLGTGDQLQVNLLDAYEKSDLFNAALDYSTLAGGYGTRLGVNYSHLNYHYNLSGLGFDGYSDNWGLYATQPWIRTSRARVDVRLEAGQQFLTDKYPSALFAGDGQDSEGRKQVSLGSLSVTGSVADLPGGVTGFGLSGTTGEVDLRSDLSRSWTAAADSG